jgi:hypothetical protein
MLEEINIGPYPGRSSQTQEGHALSTAKKMIKGQTFYCNRIKAEVGARNCKSKYAYAKAQQISASPCLECAKVLAMIRKDPTPVEPQLEIDPKEIAAMVRPAKKGTPDPIIEEVKAAVEPKLEIVTKTAPEIKEKAAPNPFAGWDQYAPGAALRGKLDVFASFTSAGILSLSVAAQEQIKLQLYSSVDVLHAKGKIGLRLHPGKKGALSIVAKTKSRSSATVSARGFLRQFKLEGVCGKRFAIREIAPGFVEIDLTSEVAA